MAFTLYPAIDVREGRVVRLRQGDYAAETRYAEDPLERALRYAEAGASWLHLVDLDAAKAGGYTLTTLLAAIRRETPLKVQTGGGVRDLAAIDALLDAGADRVVIGTQAVRQPQRVIGWLERFGSERLTIALDARADADGVFRLPVQGWTESSGLALFDLLRPYADAGLRHLLCTDIARDGMLAGLNLELYRSLASAFPGVAVQASGGVASLDELQAAHAVGADGVILGKALLEGRFSMAEALAAISQVQA
ncbi:1-(5-phosphoribosyl)-5-[(5-phosphoribosylamino)methylideneamino]imidazole-4-carboxamide isomerase [Silanimonas sp.]|uniref:1-(5-phosphoribosyl)-5-[(5- phosphoribosylamino)methylideneamino]imidazole-4- carboxamide isomerase n=1 Tax=Silanimonas sp. TaxID=1929290 RepID=UPI001BC5F008|nr:1-(5-phosphoribosyl)-5-[(5-phosphoribosylamino)methylideneamino]imidazole-4-carboxamide isomerase [Silanimonas sp.]MBS3896054.1 1-(5-phosphoribosyl)-5-[(5-phosphoribosylamino)methylideneamino]imidazole-4-carboxamide isomerase [Silanimonas sp.]